MAHEEVILPDYVETNEDNVFFRPTLIESFSASQTPFFILESFFSGKTIDKSNETGKIEISFDDVYKNYSDAPASKYTKKIHIERAINHMKENNKMIVLSRKEAGKLGPEFSNYESVHLNIISFIGITDNDTIEVKFNDDFLKLVYSKLKQDDHIKNGKVIVLDAGPINSIKNNHTRNLAYMIAKYKMTCNKVTLTLEETIAVLGCQLSEKNANTRYIRSQILNKAKEKLADTPYKFDFKIVKKLDGKKSGFMFSFESNKETNQKLIENSKERHYIYHLENIGYNQTSIKSISRKILSGTYTEQYVNYVINRSYDYLKNTKPKLKEGHKPANYVFTAFQNDYYVDEFKREPQESILLILPREVPEIEYLKRGLSVETTKNRKQIGSLELFSSNGSEKDVIRKLGNRAFPCEDNLVAFFLKQDQTIWDIDSLQKIDSIEDLKEQLLETVYPAFILNYRKVLLEAINKFSEGAISNLNIGKNVSFIKEFMQLFFRNEGRFSDLEIKRLKMFLN